MHNPRILFFDLETSPILGYAYSLYDANLIHVERDSHLLSFAYKWSDENKIHSHSLPEYKTYKKDKYDDTELLKDLHALMERADILVAHNADRFDVRVANMRFIQKGLDPLPLIPTIDTLKLARSRFRFTSNKLTDLAKYAGLGEKLHVDKDVWIGCINGDMKFWNKMVKYNEHDVFLLEGIYHWFEKWSKTKLNMNIFNDTFWNCSKCGSSKIEKRGFSITVVGKYQRYQCRDCKAWSQGTHNLLGARIGVK